MTEFINSLYPWIKALHIIAVIAWMAGLFYLPRLYVYHAEKREQISDLDDLFTLMEYRLLRIIMRPAMISAWVFGTILALIPGVVDWGMAWPWFKFGGVIAMTWFHIWLKRRHREFADGRNTITGRTYRLMNEVPTLLLVIIVFSVVLKF
ncbi:MAG: protoporphyrinogen oxidase HemJ [Aestuariivita sp.]|nr:protoporphyrinogen oxidase HemJ [Aestuariivita sp.]MCY4202569.1 protoporphyrinogen oxidase HemJ [Aestuariivita sp.]MCY4289263.1 protoporphyrinogen oxidase HemJ [Aestuariivita sp.]MCY4347368.1 protoporphyrinogen oxidase HemJ [Aestuariivita sp.]